MHASTNQSAYRQATAQFKTAPASSAAVLPASVYRRRRIMAAIALIGALLTALVSTQTADATSTSVKPRVSYVTVYSGESLWQIAERVAPDTDPRDFIDAVMQINALKTPEVKAGQRLILPGQ